MNIIIREIFKISFYLETLEEEEVAKEDVDVLLSRRRLAGISTFTLRCLVVDGRLDELCDMMVFEDKIFLKVDGR